MQAHQPTRVARTFAEAKSLGHEETDARPSPECLERGVHFTGITRIVGRKDIKQTHQPTHIARTFSEAKSLGHEVTDARPSSENLERGVHLTAAVELDAVCFTGLCGDPDPNYRLVGYYDAQGNCNRFVRVPC
jgi:hypothetical protein